VFDVLLSHEESFIYYKMSAQGESPKGLEQFLDVFEHKEGGYSALFLPQRALDLPGGGLVTREGGGCEDLVHEAGHVPLSKSWFLLLSSFFLSSPSSSSSSCSPLLLLLLLIGSLSAFFLFLFLFLSLFFFASFFSILQVFAGVDHAVKNGDAKKVAKLMRLDPGFNVNQQDGYGYTLLHHACDGDSRSPVIPLLLAHPDIDVNLKDSYGYTPFYCLLWTPLLCP